MDWGLCGERNCWGTKASWRRRGRRSTGAGQYDACWNSGIDVQRAQKDVWGDAGCYQRQSEWSCKYRWWGVWGRRRWWRDWAGQFERRWPTRLGDAHNHQHGPAAHGEVSAEADDARRIDSTGMGGCSRGKKYGTTELRVPAVVQPQTNDDTPARPPATFGELMENFDIVPGISQRPQGTSRPGTSQIRPGSVKPQSKSSIPSGEPAAEPDLSMLLKAKPVQWVSFYPCIEPPANHHIDIGFRRRDGDGWSICGRIEVQTVLFDVWSRWKASCLTILPRVSFGLISVTKLWDMIICLCMCKGRTHHVKVQKSKSGC